jgi:hypothetical protein
MDTFMTRLLVCEVDHCVHLFPHSRMRTIHYSECSSSHPVLFHLLDQKTPFAQQTNVCEYVILLFLDAFGYYHGGAAVNARCIACILCNRVFVQFGEVEIVIPILGHTFASYTPGAKLVGDDCVTLTGRIWYNGDTLTAGV